MGDVTASARLSLLSLMKILSRDFKLSWNRLVILTVSVPKNEGKQRHRNEESRITKGVSVSKC